MFVAQLFVQVYALLLWRRVASPYQHEDIQHRPVSLEDFDASNDNALLFSFIRASYRIAICSAGFFVLPRPYPPQ
jgi:hypothetical protein